MDGCDVYAVDKGDIQKFRIISILTSYLRFEKRLYNHESKPAFSVFRPNSFR